MFEQVSNWLDNVLKQDIPKDVVAFALIYTMMEIIIGLWN